MSLRTSVRLVATLVPLAMLAPAVAHAERVVVDDTVGDVVSTVSDPFLIGGDELVAAPDHASADITRTVVDHGVDRLRVTASFRDLRTSYSAQAVMRVRTPQRSWTVYAQRSGRQSVSALYAGREVACRGLRTTFDPAADTVSLRVPTSCLGDPRWVQVAMVLASAEVRHDPELGDVVDAFVDDPFASGWTGDGMPTAGPRVPRG